ncbi:MAG: adenosylcobinamide-phosphate synthase CbiB [Chloroflexales bacterium]
MSSRLHTRARALLIALAADGLLGELPNTLHPVVWVGRWLGLGEQIAPQGDLRRLAWGATWLGLSAGGAGALARLAPQHPLAQGVLASTLLAYRALDRAVGEVQVALAHDDLAEAQRLLGWHLVSRPTGELRADEVAAAAIESLAENLSDSLIAPVLAYLAGELPGLAVYRLSNTADAMWGYHNQRYEYLGKAAAHLDDLLNLAPSRLTAAMIVIATQMVNRRGVTAWAAAWRDHARTASPNAGWPMAAMAGALDTVLEKREHYRLGSGRRIADAAMVGEARTIARVVVAGVAFALLYGAIS